MSGASGRADIRQGMRVLDADNQLLGTVEAVDNDGITINGQEVPLGAGSRVHEGHVHLKGAGSLYMSPHGGNLATSAAGGTGPVHIPVGEERLDVQKREVELGEVRINKTVTEEERTVPVELRREEVRVHEENVADRPVQAGEQVFQEDSIRVPVRGEEAVVSKEAVVTGEVVISKERVAEQQEVTETIRREHVEPVGIFDRTSAGSAQSLVGGQPATGGGTFDRAAPSTATGRATSGSVTPAEQVRGDSHAGLAATRQPAAPTTGAMPANAPASAARGEQVGEELVIPLVEERLGVETRGTERGEVEIRRAVVEQPVEVPVDVMREEVHVERRDIADRPITTADAERLFEAGAIRVPVHGEQVIVGKEAVITGEVVIGKEQLVEHQEIADTLRKQQVTVAENYAAHLPAFQQHFAQRREVYRAPRTFAQAEPNYRVGFEAGSDERYAGREFEHVEPELRRTYEGTATTTVAGESGWEHLREEVREGFDRARSR